MSLAVVSAANFANVNNNGNSNNNNASNVLGVRPDSLPAQLLGLDSMCGLREGRDILSEFFPMNDNHLNTVTTGVLAFTSFKTDAGGLDFLF